MYSYLVIFDSRYSMELYRAIKNFVTSANGSEMTAENSDPDHAQKPSLTPDEAGKYIYVLQGYIDIVKLR